VKLSIDDNILRYAPKTLSLDDILKSFGDQFSTNVQNMLHSCDLKCMPSSENVIQLQSMRLPLANLSVLEYIINKLKKRKGPGNDQITVWDLQHLSKNKTFMDCLLKIINDSIKNGIYPESLKVSITRPIYKGAAHKDPANYRPIAILSVLDKVLERYIDMRITDYIQEFNILDVRQWAYQKNKGAEMLLADLSNYINNNMSKNEHTLAIFIDYSKAFDTLNHSKLLKKLEEIGVRGPALSLLKSYLTNRSFRVKIDGKLS
jgi:hypothetical protein